MSSDTTRNPSSSNSPSPFASTSNAARELFERALRRRPTEPPPGLEPPPELSGALPVVGHTVEFVRDAIGMLTRAQRELGEIAALRVAGRRMVAVFGPEAHEQMFREPDTVLSPQEAYKIMTPIFGEGLVYDAEPDKMNEQFRMLLPALKDRRMRTYGEIVVHEVEKSIADWGDEGVLDLADYCRVLTNFTSSAALLGAEFRDGMTEEFARVYHALERGVTPLAYLNHKLPIPSFRARDRARDRLVEMISEIVEARRATGRRGEDFLQTLMDASYKDGTPLTHDEITGMLLAAMFAGHHTSSVTTAWSLIELLQNRHYLGRVIEELEETFGDDGAVTFDALRNIPLTENAVKEALRLHPPLFMLVRVAREDYVYKNYFMPAGTWFLMSPTVSQRIPEVFPDPMSFDPDRFAPPREEGRQTYGFIPFGAGRHKCMGNAFALLQVKAILAILLRRYEFQMVDRNIGEDFQGLVVGPSDPCLLRYKRREPVDRRGDATARGASASASMCPAHAAAAEESKPEPLIEPGRPYRIELDVDMCRGHAVCAGEAPEVFAVVEDRVTLKLAEPGEQYREQVEAAVRHCPQHVIRVVAID